MHLKEPSARLYKWAEGQQVKMLWFALVLTEQQAFQSRWWRYTVTIQST